MARAAHLEALIVAEKQRERATREILLGKKRRELEVEIAVNNDTGGEEKIKMLFRAASREKYEDLLKKYPPTTEQKKEGATFDINQFGPALIGECLVDPDLSFEDAKALWSSDTWSQGELINLFSKAIDVCNMSGADMAPIVRGSG